MVGWDAPSDDGGDPVTGYIIEKATSTTANAFSGAGSVGAATTQFKLSRLYEGTEYLIRVMAENRVGLSAPVTTDSPIKARLPYGKCPCPFSKELGISI